MLSESLGDLLATMDTISKINGVAERDRSVIEAKQSRERNFLDQVLGLAQVTESKGKRNESDDMDTDDMTMGMGPTKYSDDEITLDFEDPDHALLIMDLAAASGVAAGEIIPSRLPDGGVRLHIMPSVFVSDNMEAVRNAVNLAIYEGDYDRYDAFVTDLMERNKSHDADTGKFASQADITRARAGSRSFQFSRPEDGIKDTRKADDKKATYNKPDFVRQDGKGFRIRKNPCGRAARPYFRRTKGLPEIPREQWYKRCHDDKTPAWSVPKTSRRRGQRRALATEGVVFMTPKEAAREMLGLALREKSKG